MSHGSRVHTQDKALPLNGILGAAAGEERKEREAFRENLRWRDGAQRLLLSGGLQLQLTLEEELLWCQRGGRMVTSKATAMRRPVMQTGPQTPLARCDRSRLPCAAPLQSSAPGWGA